MGGGKFIQTQSGSFDVIMNVLIGIKRSLSNLVEIPQLGLSEWQFERKLMTESDWMSSNAYLQNATFRFYDYAPLVF